MAHLSGFGLENFRVFKEYTWFDFAPITILVGPNNSGKSSLIKALLLLKDNVEKKNLPPYFQKVGEAYSKDWQSGEPDYNDYNEVFEPSILEFDGRVHGMNSAVSTKNKNSNLNIFSFNIAYKIESGKEKDDKGVTFDEIEKTFKQDITRRSLILKPRSESQKSMDRLISDEGLKALKKKIGEGALNSKYDFKIFHKTIKYKLTFFVADDGEAKSTNKLELLNEKDNCFLRITDHEVFFIPKLYDELFIDAADHIGQLLPFYIESVTEGFGVSFLTWFISNGLDQGRSEELSKKIFKKLHLHETNGLITPSKIIDVIEKADYLATSKNDQERIYIDSKQSISQAQLKELLIAQKKGFNSDDFLDNASNLFGIKGKIRIEYDIERGTIFPNINGYSFIDFGYGYSQLAFLLFKLATNIHRKFFLSNFDQWEFDDRSTNFLILEEPETNLHPSFQSKLADLISKSIDDYNMQFLIETHSEYLIRKLQYLTAKGEVKPEDVVIYYFNDPNNIPAGEKQVKKINILEDGSLSDDFGPGFYDEAATWELELLKLKRNKNRQN